jgi:hypothetical protein
MKIYLDLSLARAPAEVAPLRPHWREKAEQRFIFSLFKCSLARAPAEVASLRAHWREKAGLAAALRPLHEELYFHWLGRQLKLRLYGLTDVRKLVSQLPCALFMKLSFLWLRLQLKLRRSQAHWREKADLAAPCRN